MAEQNKSLFGIAAKTGAAKGGRVEQRIILWDTGIEADWVRANYLIGFAKDTPYAEFIVQLIEDYTEQHWRLEFSPYQAIRVTTIDCVHYYWESLGMQWPEQNGGFFEVLHSEWIQALGKGKDNVQFLDKARHFIIHTYDDTIEVIALRCEISKISTDAGQKEKSPNGQDDFSLR